MLILIVWYHYPRASFRVVLLEEVRDNNNHFRLQTRIDLDSKNFFWVRSISCIYAAISEPAKTLATSSVYLIVLTSLFRSLDEIKLMKLV